MSDAPVDVANLTEDDVDDAEMPRARITRRQAVLFGVFVVVIVAFLYFGLPRLAGFDDALKEVRHGNPFWLSMCVVFEVCSFGGYIWLFRAVFVHGSTRIGWRASYEITMAGLAATRLFATAGAGGAALTAWALRRSGMRARTVASRMVAQYALLYGVYMLAMVISGLGMWFGIFAGSDDFALTVVPAIFGLTVLTLVLGCTLIPGQIDRRLARWAQGSGRVARSVAQASKVPAAVGDGVREALRLARSGEWGVLGAIVWWLFDILTLWAAFHAFSALGAPPPFAALVMAYYVGMLANLLPLPGGIGGVDGGMIGVLIAFGVKPDLAFLAVLTYRTFSFWLPTIPGGIAYLQLRKTVQVWTAERRAEAALLDGSTVSGNAGPGRGTIQSEVNIPTQRTQIP
jgi:putative heme transporter